jgi:hypothetical protein
MPSPEAGVEAIILFITTNSKVAASATVAEKIQMVALLREEAERLEGGPAQVWEKWLSPRPELRERCIECQMAAAVLLETTLTDSAERTAIMQGSPGLRGWLTPRVECFTNPRLRAVVLRALTDS